MGPFCCAASVVSCAWQRYSPLGLTRAGQVFAMSCRQRAREKHQQQRAATTPDGATLPGW